MIKMVSEIITLLNLNTNGLKLINKKIRDLIEEFRVEIISDMKRKLEFEISEKPEYNKKVIGKLGLQNIGYDILKLKSSNIDFKQIEENYLQKLAKYRYHINSFYPTGSLSKFADDLDVFIETELMFKEKKEVLNNIKG